ncbi:aKG-HExxH-type peptide beta-hydroxylase [Paraliomyxa miuraensis]|uniref:aKG-HExxH-type peptide beta-hydroxylase n=1 Tax=Paraliomyxa miuraensis TaxID=376150 RepID=UPI002258626B|nr:HEXXH motif-containing putative peptide modification protein [Paraliomyxa miuraensis]MCX4239801.1 HEXXH motif-containing putative peptide modification protein [Paraliomyxa miuraensis]
MSTVPTLPDFCVPVPGSTTLHAVLSGALRRALGDLRAVLHAYASGPWAADVAAFARAVGPLLRSQPGAIAAVVRRPEVGVWLRSLRPHAAQAVDPALGIPTLLCTIGLELARTETLRGPLRLRAWPRRVLGGGGRLALEIPPGTTALSFEPGAVWAERGAERQALPLVPDDLAFLPLPGSAVRLALVDDNPWAALEAHPDKSGNALDLGGQPAERWQAALGEALSIIERHLPPFRVEIEQVLRQVVPVGWFPEQHLSASVQEAIGTVYLSLHPNPMTMVEAVIHEVSHNKLAALCELDPVLENAPDERYASPVRPDPRPLWGVLLAVHAFLPVAALYAAMIEAGAPGSERPEVRRRLERIVEGNREGTEVLRAHARPTAAGAELLAEIEALDP